HLCSSRGHELFCTSASFLQYSPCQTRKTYNLRSCTSFHFAIVKKRRFLLKCHLFRYNIKNRVPTRISLQLLLYFISNEISVCYAGRACYHTLCHKVTSNQLWYLSFLRMKLLVSFGVMYLPLHYWSFSHYNINYTISNYKAF